MIYKPIIECIKSISDLDIELKNISNHRGQCNPNSTELFRGQGRNCWSLIPNIGRKWKDPEKIKVVERRMITEFSDELKNQKLKDHIQIGYYNATFHSVWLLIQQAQHYEIPTRFMDWTGSGHVALYFAVVDEKDYGCDGQFWIYFVPPEKWVSDGDDYKKYLYCDPFEFKDSIFLNSSKLESNDSLIKIAHNRKSVQRGRFCVQPYSKVIKPLEEQDEHKPYLHKIVILKEAKKSIREELAKQEITKEKLYKLEPPLGFDPEIYTDTIKKIDKVVSKLKEDNGF